jgi:hypothetical protein
MRYLPILPAVLVVVSLANPRQAPAQEASKVRFDPSDVQVGFPAMPEPGEPPDERGRTTLFKAGFWTPVYVSFSTGPEEVRAGQVAVESTDTDDVQHSYIVPIPTGGLRGGETHHFVTYTRPGAAGSDIDVTVQADRNRYEVKKTEYALGPGDVLYLALGSRLAGLRQTLSEQNTKANRLSQMRAAYLERNVRGLPTEWFGYSAVDLMILTTGDADFVSALTNDTDHRKEALAEWVRRGGRLVISLGRNTHAVIPLLHAMQMDDLPVAIKGTRKVTNLDSLLGWLPPGQPAMLVPAGKSQPGAPSEIEIAQLEPGKDAELIVPSRDADKSPLLLARMPYGLGQVTLVAFDLDQRPFTAWGGQAEFWKKLQDKLHVKPFEPPADAGNGYKYNPYNYGQFSNELEGALARQLESFTDVPIISFGWVALFILIYIIIVGPLDYLFLKKVVKRLELTWITFPAVVVIVSAVAYFAAYALKGNELKINKIDLVDIDLRSGRAFGNTWFTLFSPRIQLYTVGVQPALPSPPPGKPEEELGSVVVSWLGRPEEGYGGYGRARSQSLFRRTYEYAPEAAGLKGVPIQVWSTKSFAATWERPCDPARPAIQADLRLQHPLPAVEGSVTNQLPVRLVDAFLIHSEGRTDSNGKVYSLGAMEPGKPVALRPGSQAPSLAQWMGEGSSGASNVPSTPASGSLSALMRRIMFHGASPQESSGNSALQHLDQSWRRMRQHEAVLVARLQRKEGLAETVSQDPETTSRLWLGELPGGAATRPALAGTMTQETFIRVWIPLP